MRGKAQIVRGDLAMFLMKKGTKRKVKLNAL